LAKQIQITRKNLPRQESGLLNHRKKTLPEPIRKRKNAGRRSAGPVYEKPARGKKSAPRRNGQRQKYFLPNATKGDAKKTATGRGESDEEQNAIRDSFKLGGAAKKREKIRKKRNENRREGGGEKEVPQPGRKQDLQSETRN